MEQKLQVGDRVQVSNRWDKYDGLTGTISVGVDELGFFRVNIDPDPEWGRQHNYNPKSWSNWYFHTDKLVKIVPPAPATYTPGQRIIVKGAEGLSDLFNGLVGVVLKQVEDSGPYLCEFDEKDSIFGSSVKRIVLPSIWMIPAPEEPAAEDQSVALAALLQKYRLEDRRRTVVSSSVLDKHRAAEVLALLEGK